MHTANYSQQSCRLLPAVNSRSNISDSDRSPCGHTLSRRVHSWHPSRRPAHTLRVDAVQQNDASTQTPVKTWPVPRDAEETAQQAQSAALRAWQDGIKRQRVELLLPLIGATDLDDWPGGIRQQFKAVLPMVESMLKEMKKAPGLEGRLTGTILDQGDAVGAWQGDGVAVVVFPTAETLKQVIAMADARRSGLVMMINPQWQQGQVVSDFGFFGRKKAEEFLESFEDTYYLRQLRISGDSIRILRSYPGPWQVHVVNDATGEDAIISTMAQRPTYAELDALLQATPGSNASKGWAERLRSELQFNQDSLKNNKD